MAQELKKKLAMLVAAVNKRNIMKATQLGTYQGDQVSGSVRRFLHYLDAMKHVCFNKSIADPALAAKEVAQAKDKAAAKAKAAAAYAKAAGSSGDALPLGEEEDPLGEEEPRFTLQEVSDMYDKLPNKVINERLLRMSVWVTDEDASDYLAVFASSDAKRSELLGMAPGKGARTKHGVVMHGKNATPFRQCRFDSQAYLSWSSPHPCV